MTHILLVDDDEDEHLFFKWALEKINASTLLYEAYTCEQAVRILGQAIPDIIFLDINLPGSDGFECLQDIKKLPAASRVPVFMYSTEITQRSILLAKELGAQGCIRKTRADTGLSESILDMIKKIASGADNPLLLT